MKCQPVDHNFFLPNLSPLLFALHTQQNSAVPSIIPNNTELEKKSNERRGIGMKTCERRICFSCDHNYACAMVPLCVKCCPVLFATACLCGRKCCVRWREVKSGSKSADIVPFASPRPLQTFLTASHLRCRCSVSPTHRDTLAREDQRCLRGAASE